MLNPPLLSNAAVGALTGFVLAMTIAPFRVTKV